MNELRFAIITKTDKTFVEISPERFREVIKDCLAKGMTIDEAFDTCEKELKQLTLNT